jgi:adenylate kinase family enzyme
VARQFCVVGNSGSGKTHLARRLSARLGLPLLELDALNHRPGWQEAPVEEFRAEVRRVLDGYDRSHGGWVVDGNYRARIADLLYADTFVWLDYPRRVVAPRIVGRTLGRLLLRRELWNGNRERWRALVSRHPGENIVLWSFSQHGEYHRAYEAESAAAGNATWVRLRSPREADRWLADVGADEPRQ